MSMNPSATIIRDASEADFPALATLWHQGWRDGHAKVVPADLTAIRTLARFRDRLAAETGPIRVAGLVGAPMGFHICRSDQLYQFYVGSASRGTGLAAHLLHDAETHMARMGTRQAWLACAVGNSRAARFYERGGWQRQDTRDLEVGGTDSPFMLRVWIYRKDLVTPGPSG